MEGAGRRGEAKRRRRRFLSSLPLPLLALFCARSNFRAFQKAKNASNLRIALRKRFLRRLNNYKKFAHLLWFTTTRKAEKSMKGQVTKRVPKYSWLLIIQTFKANIFGSSYRGTGFQPTPIITCILTGRTEPFWLKKFTQRTTRQLKNTRCSCRLEIWFKLNQFYGVCFVWVWGSSYRG